MVLTVLANKDKQAKKNHLLSTKAEKVEESLGGKKTEIGDRKE